MPLLFLALTALALLVQMTPAQTPDTDSAELQRLEQVWNDAHEKGDADALEKLWADDMEVAVPKIPVMTKADVLKFAQSGRMKFLVYRTSDVRVRVYGNAAVVTGKLLRKRSMNGQEITDNWQFTKCMSLILNTGAWFRSMRQTHNSRSSMFRFNSCLLER